MNKFISKEILDELSYKSKLGKSLKQISLRNTSLQDILEDIGGYRSNYIDILIGENLIGSRFKSDDSIMRKYIKTLENNGGFKQCFNDVLGFPLKLDSYPTEYPEYFRVVDLRNGKLIDDGYHAVHLYYQRDNLAYPIEIQLWCESDYTFNIWTHKHTYKYKTPTIGKKLYEEYKLGSIVSEKGFIDRLKELEGI